MATPELEHLRYSSVQTYLLCGRCWELKYLERLPAPVSPALAFGRAFHETIGAFLRENKQLRSRDVAVELWKSQWRRKLDQEGGSIAWGADSPDALLQLGVRMFNSPGVVHTLNTIDPALGPDGHVVLERRVEMNVKDVPVPIIGYVDVIASDGVPADFKTASRSWNEDDAATELQPAFYIAALERSGHASNSRRQFRHYIFTKTKEPKAQVIETARSPGDLAFMEDLVRCVWNGVKSGVFVPNPVTWKCSPKQCEYWAVCRARADIAAS